MKGLLSIIVLVLDIVAIMDAVKSSMATNKKILWIILIVLFPLLGVALYFLVGKKK